MTVSLRDFDGTTRLEGDLLATGGATGDVLTQQADGTYEPAPGGSLPDPLTTTINVELPAGGSILDATVDTLDDAEISLDIEDNGAVTLSLSAGEGVDGSASINLGDDDYDGGITLNTAGGSNITPRSTVDSGDSAIAIGAGSDQLRILRDGYVVIRNHAAPDDTDLNAGDMAIWFDQTNGAGKLMIKARTANGTYATAAVALS